MAQAHLAPDQNCILMSCLGKVVRAWWDGNVGVSDSREGRDGVIYAVFEDVTTFTTEVPNVVWGLPGMTTGSRGPL